MKKWLLLVSALLLAGVVQAGQFKTIKDAEIHYVVFNSTFMTPQVARSYGLKRNEFIATVNVSVLDRASAGKPALQVGIKGEAKNLIGQTKTLEFREIKEGDAIYYLAQFPIVNEELYKFTIDVDAGNKGRGPISFSQKLYVEQ
ncbi:DUF4426 domain-containing protein [Vibrio hangzhouensis]|uniref:DUF4426 domain-containing protein n=1 Tax=Vibrio hangzhouensis TaxID=462991 RepID=UPI001C944272|nr:DUF4426 domain-containing protein [Vibrio hangzhouensis]MBY6199501.1 DUF4426 domain-containing protein [Vibrio hangzhouensis]